MRSRGGEEICNAVAYALRPTCHDCYFPGKLAHAHIISKTREHVNIEGRMTKDEFMSSAPYGAKIAKLSISCRPRLKARGSSGGISYTYPWANARLT
jgi:hypothetical protein